MNSKLIASIANAVLYEGYMLYPYRPSAVKNRQRWSFGVIYPRSHCEIQNGSDSWFMQTQCLIRGTAYAIVDIKVRFLQAVSRRVDRLESAIAADDADPTFEILEALEDGNKPVQSWQEAIERDVELLSVRLANLLAGPVARSFSYSGACEWEPVKGDRTAIAARIVRTHKEIHGSIEVSTEKIDAELFRLTVLISNLVSLEDPQELSREDVLLRSLVSAHTVLGIKGGEFVSLIDPPSGLQQIASECRNVGTWPVLVGEDDRKDAMLSSPIILYDYPQIAPESPGDLFDGTEIDEILALRILTLSEDEKREIRQTDERAREVLERTEKMPMEHFLKLHGVLRGMKPVDDSGDPPTREDER